MTEIQAISNESGRTDITLKYQNGNKKYTHNEDFYKRRIKKNTRSV